MISILNCQSCKYQLDKSWSACPNCGAIIEENLVNCKQCHLLIPEDSAFCMYCAYAQKIQFKSKLTGFDLSEDQSPHILETKTKISRTDFMSSLKFDSYSTGRIVSSANFTKIALTTLILSGISLALTVLTVGAVFGHTSSTRDAFNNFVMISGLEIFGLIWITMFTNMQFKALGVPTSFKMNLRYFGICSIALIAKDIFMYPAMMYIVFFEGSSGFDMAVGVYVTISSLVIAFLIIHAINYYRYTTGYGLGINVLFFVMSVLLSLLMIVYTTEILIAILGIQ